MENPSYKTLSLLSGDDWVQRYSQTYIRYDGKVRYVSAVNGAHKLCVYPLKDEKKQEVSMLPDDLPRLPDDQVRFNKEIAQQVALWCADNLRSPWTSSYSFTLPSGERIDFMAVWRVLSSTLPTTIYRHLSYCYLLWEGSYGADAFCNFILGLPRTAEDRTPFHYTATELVRYFRGHLSDYVENYALDIIRAYFETNRDLLLPLMSDNDLRDIRTPDFRTAITQRVPVEILDVDLKLLTLERPQSRWFLSSVITKGSQPYYIGHRNERQYKRGFTYENSYLGHLSHEEVVPSKLSIKATVDVLDDAYSFKNPDRIMLRTKDVVDEIKKAGFLLLSNNIIISKESIFYKNIKVGAWRNNSFMLSKPAFKQELEEIIIDPIFNRSY